MFKFLVNKKSTKQSLKNLSVFLKDKGYSIPHHILLEALAKVFFVKNWNTLKAMSESNNEIPVYDNEIKYTIIFRPENSFDYDKILVIFNKNLVFKEDFNFYIEDISLFENTYHLRFSLKEKNKFWTTYLLLVGKSLKDNNIKMKRFEYIKQTKSIEKIDILYSLEEIDYERLNPAIFIEN